MNRPNAEQPQIERYMDGTCPHPAIPAMGHSVQRVARDGLPRHVHVVHEICLIEEGELDWYVDKIDYHIPPGSIFLSRPGEQHGASDTAIQPCRLRWLQIDIKRYPHPDQLARLTALHGHVWPGAHHLLSHFDAIMEECRKPAEDSNDIIEAHLRLLVAGIIRLDRSEEPADGLPTTLQRVCDHLCEHLDKPLLISECCHVGGVGRSRLHRLFRMYMQCSPGAWHHRQRIDHAKRRLRAGASVTDCALELGYSSSQHFARTFKRHCGTSPSQWAKDHG